MLRILLAKDLRRAWRNPLPAIINIALPICITALIGLAFGGRNENELEKIKFAVVDEDQSLLSKMLRGAMNQDQASEHLAPVFVDRNTALRKINDNEIGGALIIPTNFTHDYFSGHDGVKLELIKNPAQSIQPAALEELAATAVAVLNGLARNFKAQFPDSRGAFEGEVDYHRVSSIIETVGDRMEAMKKHINPPLISYEKDTNVSTILSPRNQVSGKPEKAITQTTNSSSTSSAARSAGLEGKMNVDAGTSSKRQVAEAPAAESKPAGLKRVSYLTQVFAWVLPGMSAMFLLFLANNAMTDLYREMRFRTFERFQTLRTQLLPFVLGKVLFTMVYLLLCAAIMLAGGGLIFRVEWQQPLALATLVVAYAASASAIMALLVALVPDERRATTLNSVVSMLLGFAGGCLLPTRQLPQLVREHITPYLPSNWFVEAAHHLQEGNTVAWQWLALKLVLMGVVLVIAAVVIFQRRISRGVARMKHILDIGHNDLRLFLKRKSAYVWLFVVPLLFMYFFGAAMRGPGDPYNRRPRVLIENADTNFLGKLLIDELGETLKCVKPEEAADAAAVIRIPEDFTAKVLAFEQVKVQLAGGKNTDEPADPTIIEFRLVRALIALNGHMLEAVTETNGVVPLTKGRLRAVIEKPNPVSLDARFAGRKPVPSGFNFSLPSNLVTYLLMNLLIFGGATMAAERRNGVIKRMMIHPITRGDLVMGKIYGLMLLGIVQMTFFLALGKFAFGVNLGANLPAVTFVLLVFAWVAASLGVLIGSVLAAEDRVAGICVLIALLMAALGGCWWPLEMAPPAAKTIALFVPTGWAMQALNQLITFGNGFSAVLVPVTVLLGFGIAANLLAARFFRN